MFVPEEIVNWKFGVHQEILTPKQHLYETSTEAGRNLWPVADINLTGFYNFLDSFSTFCSYDIPNLFNIEIKIFVECCNNDFQINSSRNFSNASFSSVSLKNLLTKMLTHSSEAALEKETTLTITHFGLLWDYTDTFLNHEAFLLKTRQLLGNNFCISSIEFLPHRKQECPFFSSMLQPYEPVIPRIKTAFQHL